MSTVIKVENLGKKYSLNHKTGSGSYLTLRDSLTSIFKRNPLNNSTEEEFWALKDLNLEIKHGDRVGVIGQNGAGKSTLLKILSRITEPTSGKISVKGRIASLLEVGTGFHPELTGRENIFLNGAILGMCKTEIKQKFEEIVNFAEVEKFLDTPVKRYSSGMYVRLAFSVAAHLEPEILIVDEVLAVGDIQFQKKCLGKMEDVSREGRTILFVSHNMSALRALCNKGVLLSAGQLMYKGGVENTIEKYMSVSSKNSFFKDISGDQSLLKNNPFSVLSIESLSESNDNLSNPSCGDYLKLRIKFAVGKNHKFSSLRFGISFKDLNSNRFVTEFNSYYGSKEEVSCSEGLHCADFEISKLALAPGNYSVGIIITSGLEVLEWQKDLFNYSVGEGLFYKETERMPLPGNSPFFFHDFNFKVLNG
jgi:lipopolysaccharide transport system ATP-binding protein